MRTLFLWLCLWYQGYVKCQIRGQQLERFLSMCHYHHITCFEVTCQNQGYCFFIAMADLYALKPLLKKTHTRLWIIEKRGLPWFLKTHRYRRAFVVGMILCIVLVCSFTQRIWAIDITGNRYHTDEMLLKYLKKQQIQIGEKKTRVDAPKLEEQLRIDYPTISWVSIRLNGTHMEINLAEMIKHGSDGEDTVKTLMQTEEQTQEYKEETIRKETDVPGDIVADADGKISGIITRHGTPMVSVGDTVKAGDILISGTVSVLDDNGEEKILQRLRADGDIYAQEVMTYERDYYFENDRKIYISQKKSIGILFGGYWIGKKEYADLGKNTEVVVVCKKIKVLDQIMLPWTMVYSTKRKYAYEQFENDENKIRESAAKDLDSFLTDLEELGVQIIENSVKILIGQNGCRASGDITVIAPIGKVLTDY